MKRHFSALLALVWVFASNPAGAHKPSDSYLGIQRTDQGLQMQWAIALRDLEVAVGLDSDADRRITWGELQAGATRVGDYASSHLLLEYAGQPQALTRIGMQVADKTDGSYAVLLLQAPPPPAQAAVALDYRLLFELDPTHRGLIAYSDGGRNVTRVAAPDTGRIVFTPHGTSSLTVLGDYFNEGVWHIWIGFDHILFLVTLLLPAVLVYRSRRWQPVDRVQPALLDLVKVVSAFTVAHSITLALGAWGLVSLPSRLVEASIALSVLVAALNNLWPVISAARWRLAFLFGLIHGFGFASVLGDVGLPAGALAVALAGFNLGVEAGQLAIVSLVFPLLVMTRHTRMFRRWILGGGSAAAALVACLWLVERLFGATAPFTI